MYFLLQSARRDCAFMDNEFVESFAEFDAKYVTPQRAAAVPLPRTSSAAMPTQTEVQDQVANTTGYWSTTLGRGQLEEEEDEDWARPVFV